MECVLEDEEAQNPELVTALYVEKDPNKDEDEDEAAGLACAVGWRFEHVFGHYDRNYRNTWQGNEGSDRVCQTDSRRTT